MIGMTIRALCIAALGVAATAADAASWAYCRESVSVAFKGDAYNDWNGRPLASGSDAAINAVVQFRAAMLAGDVDAASQYVLPQQRPAFLQEMADDNNVLVYAGKYALAPGQQALVLGLVDWAPYRAMIGKVSGGGMPDDDFIQAIGYSGGRPYVAWPSRDPVAVTTLLALRAMLRSACPASWTLAPALTTRVEGRALRIDVSGAEAPPGAQAPVSFALRGQPMAAKVVYPNVVYADPGVPLLEAHLARFFKQLASGNVPGAVTVGMEPNAFTFVLDQDQKEFADDYRGDPNSVQQAVQFWRQVGRVTASGSFSASPWLHVLFTNIETGAGGLPASYQFLGGGVLPPVCPQIYPYSIGDFCQNRLRVRYGEGGDSSTYLQSLSSIVQIAFAGSAQARYTVTGP